MAAIPPYVALCPAVIPEFQGLGDFIEWWMATKAMLPPSDGAIAVNGEYREWLNKAQRNTSSVVLFRHGQYQVTLLIFHPNSGIPDHSHPDVESFFVYLTGDMCFRKQGQVQQHWDSNRVKPDGTSKNFGYTRHVPPNLSHGALFGPQGGSVLSLERWLDGVRPGHVFQNWQFEGSGHARHQAAE